MRILIASQHYFPAVSMGGTVANAVAIAEGLAQQGHQVEVATTTFVEMNQPPARRGHMEYINGVMVHYMGVWFSYRKSFFNPGAWRFFGRHQAKFDWLHIIGLYDSLGPILARSARRRGIPYSVEPAGMLIPPQRSRSLKWIYNLVWGKRFLKNAAAVMVTSRKEWVEAVSSGLDPAKLVLRRNGVITDQFLQLPPRGTFRNRHRFDAVKPLILWMGRIEPIKNLEVLFAALSGIQAREWQLAVVGPAENRNYTSHLHDLVKRLSLADRVFFLAPHYGADKLAALADADMLVLVSTSENWGNTILEAMAAGVPVVVTDTCGVSDIVSDPAGIVVAGDADSIRRGITAILDDPGCRGRIQSQLTAFRVKLSWDDPIQQMIRLFAGRIQESVFDQV